MGAIRPPFPVGPRGGGATVRPPVRAAALPVGPRPPSEPPPHQVTAAGGTFTGVKRKLPAVLVPAPKRKAVGPQGGAEWQPSPGAVAAVAAAAQRVRERVAQGGHAAVAALAQPQSKWAKQRQKAKDQKATIKQVIQTGQAGAAAVQASKAATASKWAKKSKWSKASRKAWNAAQGGASGSGHGYAERIAIQELNGKLKGGDMAGTINAARRCAGAGAGSAVHASQVMPKILEFAAKKASPAQYGEVMALCSELGVQLDVNGFTKLVVILTSRIPVPTGMVRLTLNLALPEDGQVVPLIPPDATEEDERAVFEDGEPLTTAGRGHSAAPPPEAPAKELGPRPQVRDEQEAREARLTMTRVDPAALRGSVSARDEAMGAYFAHFAALLHLETLVELRALKRRLQRPQEELERFGWMVQGLEVRVAETRSITRNKGSSLPGREPGSKRARVIFAIPPRTDISRLRFRSGDSVLLSREDPMVNLTAEGIIADAPNFEEDGASRPKGGNWEERIIVTFDAAFDEQASKRGTWRLDRAANRTAYERQLMALLRMATAKDEKRIALWDILPLTGVGGGNVDAWASKMKEMLDEKQKASLEGGDGGAGGRFGQMQPSAARHASSLSPAELQLKKLCAEEPPMAMQRSLPIVRGRLRQGLGGDLNPSQCAAVSAALGRRLTLVQGPPGTGKTTVSVQLLGIWAKELRVKPLLATSDSNIAVDNIAEGVLAMGLKVVRVGRPEKVTSHLEDITLDTILRNRIEEKERREGAGAASSSNPPGKGGKKGATGAAKGKGSADSAEAKQRRVDEFEAKMAILREADVVCTTTIAAGSDFLHLLKFQAILIDEVAQATELSAIVPVALRGSDRLVLVGDHCQLPPSICSLEAETRGLSLSIFGRLAAQGVDPYFLDTQFRMHPMIAAFSAQEFYHGRLKTGVDPSNRPPPEGFLWPQNGSGIAFVHVDTPENRDGDSRTNAGEVAAVSDVLSQVLAAGELSVLEVGVVSPYSAQVRSLRQQLRRDLPARLQGTGVDLTGGLEGRRGARALEIASVDAFQGREKELIIFSAVRSNRHGNVGFLADWRRLNVMITRARRGLIIVGNTATLRGDPTWGRWLEWATESGLVIDRPHSSGSSRHFEPVPTMAPSRRPAVPSSVQREARAPPQRLEARTRRAAPHQDPYGGYYANAGLASNAHYGDSAAGGSWQDPSSAGMATMATDSYAAWLGASSQARQTWGNAYVNGYGAADDSAGQSELDQAEASAAAERGMLSEVVDVDGHESDGWTVSGEPTQRFWQ